MVITIQYLIQPFIRILLFYDILYVLNYFLNIFNSFDIPFQFLTYHILNLKLLMDILSFHQTLLINLFNNLIYPVIPVLLTNTSRLGLLEPHVLNMHINHFLRIVFSLQTLPILLFLLLIIILRYQPLINFKMVSIQPFYKELSIYQFIQFLIFIYIQPYFLGYFKKLFHVKYIVLSVIFVIFILTSFISFVSYLQTSVHICSVLLIHFLSIFNYRLLYVSGFILILTIINLIDQLNIPTITFPCYLSNLRSKFAELVINVEEVLSSDRISNTVCINIIIRIVPPIVKNFLQSYDLQRPIIFDIDSLLKQVLLIIVVFLVDMLTQFIIKVLLLFHILQNELLHQPFLYEIYFLHFLPLCSQKRLIVQFFIFKVIGDKYQFTLAQLVIQYLFKKLHLIFIILFSLQIQNLYHFFLIDLQNYRFLNTNSSFLFNTFKPVDFFSTIINSIYL